MSGLRRCEGSAVRQKNITGLFVWFSRKSYLRLHQISRMDLPAKIVND